MDDATTPLEETLEAYGELIRQGKVRAIGASNYTAERLAQALEVSKQNGYPSYHCLQPLYNLYDRAPFEEGLEPLCRQAGLGVIPYYSLASGFLTGKYRSEQDLAQEPPGRDGQEVLERTRVSHPQGSRPGCRAVPFDAGSGGPRLAELAPQRDRTDCKCNKPRATWRPDRGNAARAGRPGDRALESGQCVKAMRLQPGGELFASLRCFSACHGLGIARARLAR